MLQPHFGQDATTTRKTCAPPSLIKGSTLTDPIPHLNSHQYVGATENRRLLYPRYSTSPRAVLLHNATADTVHADLKNTTDDAIPNYLNSLKFRQSHKLTDVRLALGYTAVIIAGALFYFDYKFGWDASKPFTAPAVVAYFLLNSAFMYWMYFVEKGLVYSGEKDGLKVRNPQATPWSHVQTHLDHHTDRGFPRSWKSLHALRRTFRSTT